MPAMDWTSDEYAFAEAYAVWGWMRVETDCK